MAGVVDFRFWIFGFSIWGGGVRLVLALTPTLSRDGAMREIDAVRTGEGGTN
jgi:hypothetical protein